MSVKHECLLVLHKTKLVCFITQCIIVTPLALHFVMSHVICCFSLLLQEFHSYYHFQDNCMLNRASSSIDIPGALLEQRTYAYFISMC